MGLMVLFCVYSLGIPWVTSQMGPLRGEPPSVLRFPPPPISQQILFRSFEFLVAAWFFMFGACIGSFLNVVIYRTPRGLSLLGSSRCPYCRSSIRFYDNIPVFAWIVLRGRCRDCRLPISPRYPLVEFATGMVFLVLAILELFLAGENLPADYGRLRLSVSWLVHHFPWDLVAVYLYHSTLLCILLSWTLIKFDGHMLPKFYILLAMVVGLAVPAMNPSVQPVSWIAALPEWLADKSWVNRLDTSVIGLICGSGIGLVLSLVRIISSPAAGQGTSHIRDTTAVMGLVGLFLGWQAVVSIAGIAACTRLLGALVPATRIVVGSTGARRSLGSDGESTSNDLFLLMHISIATALHIVVWDRLAQLSWWPGPGCSVLAVMVVVMLTVLLVFASDAIQRARSRSLPSGDIPE